MKEKLKRGKIDKIKNISSEILNSIDNDDLIFEDISKIYNLSCEISEKVSDDSYKENEKTKMKNENLFATITQKIEISMGTKLLNIIGIILIVMSLIIGTGYVYFKYLNNEAKGVALALVSILGIILGEKIFRKRNKIFSTIFSVVGVIGIYSTLVMNYMFFKTMDRMVLVITSFIITNIIFYYTYKRNLQLLRLITLISSFIATIYVLFEKYYHNVTIINEEKLITSSMFICVLLAIISLSNSVMIIRNSKNTKLTFETYSTFIVLILTIVMGKFMDPGVYHLLTLLYLFTTNVLFIRSSNKENRIQKIIMILNSVVLITLTYANMSLYQEIILSGIMLAIMMLFTIFSRKNEYIDYYYGKSIILFGILILFLDSLSSFSNTLLIVILVITLMFITVIVDTTKSNAMRRVIKYSSLIYTTVYFISINHSHFLMGCLMFTASFGIIQHILTDNINAKYYKFEMKFMKYLILLALAYTTYNITYSYTYDKFISTGFAFYYELPYICISLISQFYYIINKKVNALTINEKDDGKFILVIIIANLLLGYKGDITFLTTTAFAILDIIFLLDKKVVKFYNINKWLICSLVISLSILNLDNIRAIEVNSVMISCILVVIALVSVAVGFAKENSAIRKYGLYLAFLVSVKVVFGRLNNIGFEVKALILFVVGTVVLAISNIYNKLENKNSIDSKAVE
ncbi:hypothetical protein ABFP60_11880 [Clostridioides difficile]